MVHSDAAISLTGTNLFPPAVVLARRHQRPDQHVLTVALSASYLRCQTGQRINRTAAGIMLEANGLKSGSTVKLSSAATGSIELPVGGSGNLVGTLGIGSAVATVTVVSVTAKHSQW